MRLGQRGTVALEYAVLLPAFLALVLGGMDAGRVLWTQVTLDRAVQAAARCAAVNTTACGSTANVQAYAASQLWGMPAGGTVFTVDKPACGVRVSADLPFVFVMPWVAERAVTLHAGACYPVST